MAIEQETDRGRFTIAQSQRDRITQSIRKSHSNTRAMPDFSAVVLLVLVAILTPVIAPCPIDVANIESRPQASSVKRPFDTDDFGRDIFSHIVIGSRISLYVGFGAISGTLVAGAVVGVVTDYVGGLIDEIPTRVMDTVMASPPMLLAFTLLVVLGLELSNVAIALAFAYMPCIARVSRSAVLAERNEAYVEATITRGESSSHTVLSEVFPNRMAPMLVQGSLNVSFAILAEANLSFFGLSAQPPQSPWGPIINTGRGFVQTTPRMLLFLALTIGVVVVGFSMLGDGLRGVSDSRTETIE